MAMFKINRLTLIQKMIISYVVSGMCMSAALVYSVYGLSIMHRMQEEIARKDLAAATATISLREMMQAQERYVGRYKILKQAEFKELYKQNADMFRKELARLQLIYQGSVLSKLTVEYDDYQRLASAVFAGREIDPLILKSSSARLEMIFEQLRQEQQRSLENKLKQSDLRKTEIVGRSIAMAFGGIISTFVVAFLLIYSFATSVGKLQKATHRIAEGDFDHNPQIPPGDEIGALAQDFARMASRLKELEQISLDASPLTRLPGNIAIERALNRRLREKTPFAMCYMDLDNFKSYNDRYGYIKASELLKETGQLIYAAVKQLNDPDAFVGHIGGDDFVAIISAEQAASTCQLIIHDFDSMIRAYYSEEDRAAGAIQGIDRYGVPRVFPIVSISIAVLTCQTGKYATAAEIATAAAEVKDHVKESSGSNYIIVRESGTSAA
ncbi:MAG TPA: diguanylate cyclase [Desulfuromonadaceae bacterium]|jgi:diguanylate cyclase (GGDEF)-like protein